METNKAFKNSLSVITRLIDIVNEGKKERQYVCVPVMNNSVYAVIYDFETKEYYTKPSNEEGYINITEKVEKLIKLISPD